MLRKKKLSEDARKKKNRREKIAEIEGRVAGTNGRPCVVDKQINDIVCEMISKDANDGVFHDVKWVSEMVCVFDFVSFRV
jgi:hypothetical protein